MEREEEEKWKGLFEFEAIRWWSSAQPREEKEKKLTLIAQDSCFTSEPSPSSPPSMRSQQEKNTSVANALFSDDLFLLRLTNRCQIITSSGQAEEKSTNYGDRRSVSVIETKMRSEKQCPIR